MSQSISPTYVPNDPWLAYHTRIPLSQIHNISNYPQVSLFEKESAHRTKTFLFQYSTYHFAHRQPPMFNGNIPKVARYALVITTLMTSL